MKEIRHQIPRARGGSREGMFTVRIWNEGEPGCPPIKTPLDHLRDIVATCNRMLDGIPGPDDWYSVSNDGSVTIHGAEPDSENCTKGKPWQSALFEERDRMMGIEPHHYPVQQASAEYFAWLAREHAEKALKQLEAGDWQNALGDAMDAVANIKDMQAINAWESEVIAARGSAPGRKKRRKKAWAEELARHLEGLHPGMSARSLVQQIPYEDDIPSEIEFADGLVASRNKKKITAEAKGTLDEVGEISVDRFRKAYLGGI